MPQECGAKEEVRYASVTDRSGRGMLFEMDEKSGPMMFSALPYTPHEMENAKHVYELPQVHYTVVTCGARADGNCGRRQLDVLYSSGILTECRGKDGIYVPFPWNIGMTGRTIDVRWENPLRG